MLYDNYKLFKSHTTKGLENVSTACNKDFKCIEGDNISSLQFTKVTGAAVSIKLNQSV